MTGIRDYSPTADANLAVAGISLAEGWARASVNNAYRAGMADIADLLLDLGGAKVTTGTASAYLVSLDTEPTAYADNMLFLATSHVDNALGATLNVNGIGVKPIKTITAGIASPIGARRFPVGHIGILTYSSSNSAVILLNPRGGNIEEFDTVGDMLADVGSAEGEGTVWRADGFRYREADPAATDHHLTTAGGVKLYVQPGDDGWYNFLAMNPARDGVTNDAAKLQKLLDIRPMGGVSPANPNWVPGPSIQIPQGIYYMNAGAWGFQLKATTHIRGEGHSPDNDFRSTVLMFPKDVVGFMVNHIDTYADTVEAPPTGGALGSTFERIVVRVPNADVAQGSNPNAHGIWARTTVHFRDVTVYGFYGHGIAITGSSLPQPNPLDHGGPSSFSLANVNSWRNHNCGIFVRGHDASVGMGYRIDVNNNGRWGIYEDSFAGDVWIMVHSEVNGLALRGGNPSDSSSMVYVAEGDGTNSIYYAAHTATPAQLVTVPPGTDETVWVTYLPHYAGSVGTNYALWTAGKPVGTYFAGGSFWSANTAGRNLFICVYDEGSAPGTVGGVSMALGGVALWQGGAVFKASNAIMTTDSGYEVDDRFGNNVTIGGDPNNSATLFRALNYQSAAEASIWLWEYIAATGDWSLDYGSTTNRAYNLTSVNTTQKMGTSKAQPYLMHFPAFAVGGPTSARRQTTGTVKPTTGEWAAGDVVWNAAASTTSFAGWLCTSAGASGTTWATGTDYAVNANVFAPTASKYYRCSVDPGQILSTVLPSHTSGAVTGADGYGWTYIATPTIWTTNTDYAVGDYVRWSTGGYTYVCATDPGGAALSTIRPSHTSGTVVGADGYGWTWVGNSGVNAWVTGLDWNTTSNSYMRRSDEKLYQCTTDPGAVKSTVEPSHASGEVVGADGYGWTFVSSTALEFLPFGQAIWPDTTVAALPAAAAGNKGQRRHVTDANATTFGTTVAGGGSNVVPVFSTGAVWIIA